MARARTDPARCGTGSGETTGGVGGRAGAVAAIAASLATSPGAESPFPEVKGNQRPS